jgi:hypothetical protein
MSSELLLGLRISVIGLSVTFLAMGLVILIMVLLMRFFPAKKASGQVVDQSEPAAAEVIDEQALEEMAVALAVGICLLERDGALEYKDPSLGQLLEE